MSYEKKPHILIKGFEDADVSKVLEDLDKIESKYKPDQPVLIQIDSYGGSVKGMSVIYNRIKTMQNPIFTYTSSVAMSAGAILLSTLAPRGSRYASPEAIIMVHELQAGAVGDIKDLEDRINYVKATNKKWQNILAKSMGLKNHKDIRNLIKEKAIGQDIYLSAHQAKKLGLIDDVANLSMTSYYGWSMKKHEVK